MTVDFAKKIVERTSLSHIDHHQTIRLWLDDSADTNQFQYYQIEGYHDSTIFVMAKSFADNGALERYCNKQEVTAAIAEVLRPIMDAFPFGDLPTDVDESFPLPPPPPITQGQVAMMQPPVNYPYPAAPLPPASAASADDSSVLSDPLLTAEGSAGTQDFSTDTANTQATQ